MAGEFDWLIGGPTQPGLLGTGQYRVRRPKLGPVSAAGPRAAQLEEERQRALEQSQRDLPSIATGPQAEARAAQMRGLSLAEQAAMGRAPSAAEQALRMGTERVLRSRLAVAQGARGLGAQAALRGLGEQAILAGQESAGQAAQLRAQEMAQARGEFLAGAGAVRGADVELATRQAELEAGAQQAQDQMRLALIAQGYSADQAEQMAAQQWAELEAQLQMQAEQLQARAYESAAGRQWRATAGIAEGLGRVAGLGALKPGAGAGGA